MSIDVIIKEESHRGPLRGVAIIELLEGLDPCYCADSRILAEVMVEEKGF
jgi:hypothetical protein